MELRVGGVTVSIIKGDITEQDTDAIVNPANSSLMGGGGADGAIHRKGGPAILEECTRIRATTWRNGLPVGKAVITTAGTLKARHVIHTVGPIWRGGRLGEPVLLADCYRNSLGLAKSEGLKSVAFPAISSGAFGYPLELASSVALRTTKEFLLSEDFLRKVVFVLFTSDALETYEATAEIVFGA